MVILLVVAMCAVIITNLYDLKSINKRNKQLDYIYKKLFEENKE